MGKERDREREGERGGSQSIMAKVLYRVEGKILWGKGRNEERGVRWWNKKEIKKIINLSSYFSIHLINYLIIDQLIN